MGFARNKKPEPGCRFGFLDFYPTGAVQANHPFPFGKRRMTVAAESDFQRRPVIFRTNQASYISSTIGSGTSPQSRTSQGKFESRWFRVEWKALVSFPTLNERLSLSKNYSRNSAPRSRCKRSRIFACTALTSSLVSVRLRSRYVNRYASDFRSGPRPAALSPANKSNNSTLS